MVMENNKDINIVIASSKEYIDYAKVMLLSIFESNKRSMNIFFYYKDDMPDELQDLRSFCDRYNAKLVPMYLDEKEIGEVGGIGKAWSILNIARWKCIEDLKDVCDRALLMGVDIIVQKDISDFYDQDFDGKSFIMCEDMANFPKEYSEAHYKDIILRREKGYPNCDVTLINMNEAYKKVSFDKMLETQNMYCFEFIDQDTLFYLCKEEIKVIEPYRFNLQMQFKDKLDDDLVNSATILHWSGEKPWNSGPIGYGDIWYTYAYRLDLKSSIYKNALIKTAQRYNETEIKRKKYMAYYKVYSKIETLRISGVGLSDVLANKGLKYIMLYGAGILSKMIINECDDRITVRSIIDKVQVGEYAGVSICSLDDIKIEDDVDAIVVTPVFDYSNIHKDLLDVVGDKGIEIISLSEILES